MILPKFTREEKKTHRAIKLEQALSGGGIYIFENKSKVSEISLPRPTKKGVRKVAPGGRFEGDDYYIQLVKSGLLTLVEVVLSAAQEMEEKLQSEKKLIVDQPDQVTTEGKVEHVVKKNSKNKKIDEHNAPSSGDYLINEEPEGFVVVE